MKIPLNDDDYIVTLFHVRDDIVTSHITTSFSVSQPMSHFFNRHYRNPIRDKKLCIYLVRVEHHVESTTMVQSNVNQYV